MADPICVVLRGRNDMPLVQRTIEMVRRQDVAATVLAFDNDSTDGTTDVLKNGADRFFRVPEGTYIPGQVLNRAMREATGEFVVFLNSDCTPEDGSWLRRLVAGFTKPEVGAVFGRQKPRPDCDPLLARDTEATFGDGSRQKYWRHCFSMASSAVRRSAWTETPFREDITYSEDIDWTWRIRQKGHTIAYVADSVVFHSHNYTLAQWRRRQFGEGRAEAAIFDWAPWQRSLLRYTVLPWARLVLTDAKHSIRRGDLRSAVRSPVLRGVGAWGRRQGLLAGLRERGQL